MIEPRLYAIGDIHGDLEGLVSVFEQMSDDGYAPARDTVVQLGDVIDGYQESRRCVEYLRKRRHENRQRKSGGTILLRGNHEQMLINAIGRPFHDSQVQTWWRQGGAYTYKSYVYSRPTEWGDQQFVEKLLSNNILNEPFYPVSKPMKGDISFFAQLPTIHFQYGYVFVHAGLRPHAPAPSTSVEDRLWIREEFIDSSHQWDEGIVVYGHTAREHIDVQPNKIGIDTRWRGRGCVSAVQLGIRDQYGEVLKVFEGPRDKVM